MTSSDTSDLDRLGFGGWSFQECETLLPDTPHASHGLQAQVPLPSPRPFHAPQLADEGFAVLRTEEPCPILAIDCAQGPPQRVLPLESDPFPLAGVHCSESRVRVSLDHTGALVLDYGDYALLLRVETARRILTAVLKRPPGFFLQAPPPKVQLPPLESIERWLEESEDSWLVVQASRRIASGRPWEQLVAVGMIARLAEPNSAEQRQEILDAAIGGRVHPWLHIPRRWLDHLPAGEWAEVEAHAWAVFGMEEDELRELLINPNPMDREWLEGLRRAAHRREEIEGVSTLFREAGHTCDLPRALRELDSWVEARLRPALPLTLAPDELLERVGETDFDAWWGLHHGDE